MSCFFSAPEKGRNKKNGGNRTVLFATLFRVKRSQKKREHFFSLQILCDPVFLTQLPLPKTPNLKWVDGFPLRFGGFFLILLVKLRCCIFAGGRPRVLSKFPLKNQQNSNSELGRWISPMLWRFFRDLACEMAWVDFWRREAHGT